MDKYSISAQLRTILGKGNTVLRRQEQIPAVVYGHGKKSQSIALNYREFERILARAGESSLIDLTVDQAAPITVLIKDVQRDAVTDRLIHADFHQVDMSEKIETDIALKFEGVSAAVHEHGGVLVTNLEAVKVSCLPKDLVHEIVIDLGRLATFDDQIRISDLTFPDGLTVLDKPETVIAVVTAPRTEAELEALDTEVVEKVDEVEVTKEKPTEEAAAEEVEADSGKEK